MSLDLLKYCLLTFMTFDSEGMNRPDLPCSDILFILMFLDFLF